VRAKAAYRAPALGPPRVLELPAGPLQYFDVGGGEPIVFVHGAFVNANLWRKLLPALTREFRCVVLDLPLGSHTIPMKEGADLGEHGIVALVGDAIEALGLDGVTLVGMDTGGAVCQFIVTQRPERIGRLVLTSCDYRDNFPPRTFSHLKLMPAMPDWLIVLLFSPFRLRAVRRLPNGFGWLTYRPVERAVEDSWVLPSLEDRRVRADVKKALKIFDKRRLNHTADLLGTFDGPALIAWSADDRVFPVEHGRRLAADLRDARFELIPGARSLSMEDQPKRLAALIGEFSATTVEVSSDSLRRAVAPTPRRAAPPAAAPPPH
jgi:pimeloyl-ACP methyl ester carboxylesterase